MGASRCEDGWMGQLQSHEVGMNEFNGSCTSHSSALRIQEGRRMREKGRRMRRTRGRTLHAKKDAAREEGGRTQGRTPHARKDVAREDSWPRNTIN